MSLLQYHSYKCLSLVFPVSVFLLLSLSLNLSFKSHQMTTVLCENHVCFVFTWILQYFEFWFECSIIWWKFLTRLTWLIHTPLLPSNWNLDKMFALTGQLGQVHMAKKIFPIFLHAERWLFLLLNLWFSSKVVSKMN